jgi:DNA-binding LacI/PurR family transcriptional regulator
LRKLALGVVREFHRALVTVPDTVQVTGFDG